MRRRLVLTAAAAAAVAAVPAPAFAGSDTPKRLTLPEPTGPHRIGTVTLHLVDRSRPDPWVPAETVRQLMVQVWYPARDARWLPRSPWVSPALAAAVNPPGSGFELPVTHARVGAPALPVGAHGSPVVLYSPGFGVERTAGTAVVEELASHGYTVVTIDHTHDSPLVEFPDGHVATSAVPPPTGAPGEEDRLIAKALATRVADTRFVLDRLSRHQKSELPATMDLRRIGMIGHSLGGTTAAQTMLEDRRVKAGVNLDGAMSGRVMTEGLDRPFLLVGSDGHGRATDDTWAAFWSALRGPRLELQLRDSGHMSFTDYQVLLPQAGIPPEALVDGYGTIDGARSVRVQCAYLLAFADRYLGGHRGALLDGPSAAFPEMRFLP